MAKYSKAPEIEYEPIDVQYENNPLIKPSGTKLSYTPAMIEEFKKCSADPLYFIQNLGMTIDRSYNHCDKEGINKVFHW